MSIRADLRLAEAAVLTLRSSHTQQRVDGKLTQNAGVDQSLIHTHISLPSHLYPLPCRKNRCPTTGLQIYEIKRQKSILFRSYLFTLCKIAQGRSSQQCPPTRADNVTGGMEPEGQFYTECARPLMRMNSMKVTVENVVSLYLQIPP